MSTATDKRDALLALGAAEAHYHRLVEEMRALQDKLQYARGTARECVNSGTIGKELDLIAREVPSFDDCCAAMHESADTMLRYTRRLVYKAMGNK